MTMPDTTNTTKTATVTRAVGKARGEVGFCSPGTKARAYARRMYTKAVRREGKDQAAAY